MDKEFIFYPEEREHNLLYYPKGINHEQLEEICHHLYHKGPVDFGCSISRVETWKHRVERHFQTWLSENTDNYPFQELDMFPYKYEHASSRLRLEWDAPMENNADAVRLLSSHY